MQWKWSIQQWAWEGQEGARYLHQKWFNSPKDPGTQLWPHGSGDADLYNQLRKEEWLQAHRWVGRIQYELLSHYSCAQGVFKNSGEGKLPSMQNYTLYAWWFNLYGRSGLKYSFHGLLSCVIRGVSGWFRAWKEQNWKIWDQEFWGRGMCLGLWH